MRILPCILAGSIAFSAAAQEPPADTTSDEASSSTSNTDEAAAAPADDESTATDETQPSATDDAAGAGDQPTSNATEPESKPDKPGAAAFAGAVCPIPISDYPSVQLAHGGGGRLSQMLTETMFLEAFRNPALEPLHDGAIKYYKEQGWM